MALATVACNNSSGGATGGPSPASGSVCGNSWTVRDAIFTTGYIPNLGPGNGTLVSLRDTTGACAAEKALITSPTTLDVDIALSELDSTGSPKPISSPATYKITSSSSEAFAAAAVFEARCTTGFPVTQATSGTVTVSAVDASHVSGTLDLSFGSDRVTGAFDAANCSSYDPTTPPMCSDAGAVPSCGSGGADGG